MIRFIERILTNSTYIHCAVSFFTLFILLAIFSIALVVWREIGRQRLITQHDRFCDWFESVDGSSATKRYPWGVGRASSDFYLYNRDRFKRAGPLAFFLNVNKAFIERGS